MSFLVTEIMKFCWKCKSFFVFLKIQACILILFSFFYHFLRFKICNFEFGHRVLYEFDRIHWCLMSLIAYYCLCRYLANFVFFKIKDSTALNMTWYDQFMQCVILCIMLLLILSLYTKLLIKYPLFWCIFSFKNSCIVFVLNLEYFVKSNTSDREVL